MMETSTAIILTQLPIAFAILLGVYEMYKIRKELISLSKELGDYLKNRKR